MNSHFNTRCLERLPGVDPNALFSDLRLAFKRIQSGEDSDGDFIEFAYDVPAREDAPARLMYRFRTKEGIAFAVMSRGGGPVTVIDRSMVAAYRRKRRSIKAKMVKA
jgi:hypothetical protein